jgi:hypothetical protein
MPEDITIRPFGAKDLYARALPSRGFWGIVQTFTFYRYHGIFGRLRMSKHKKIERTKELDRRRRRREKSLKLRAKEAKTATRGK